MYTLTVSAPVEYLTDPTTVYPVTIDPTITSKDTMTASNIEDATVFSGYPNNNFGNYVFNTIGYQDATYGTGRVAVRLKGLLNDATYQGLSAADISSVLFYMKDGGSNYAYVNIHALTGNSTWTESTIKNSNLGTVSDMVYANGRMGGSAWTAFNLTTLVRDWKDGDQNGQCGFLMVIADSTKKIGALSCEYGSGDYWPYVVVEYTVSSVLNYSVKDIVEGSSFTLTANTGGVAADITWTSNNTTVATVDTEGVVTGINAGTAVITATSDVFTNPVVCVVNVVITNGVYYIKNASSGLCLQGAAGSTTIGAQRTDQETRLDQLWKIAHVGGGYYVIRPMMDFGAALTINSDDYVGVADAAAEDDTVGAVSRWTITRNSFGIAFKRYGSNAETMMPVTSSQPGSTVHPGTWNAIYACHWELESAKGIFLRDTSTLEAITSSTSKFILLGKSAIRAELGIRYEVYGSSQIPTWYPEDSTIAEVDSYTGKVTGVECDVTDIMAKVTIDNITYSQSYQLCVMAIPEGTYYLQNKQTRYYADFDSFEIADGSSVYQYELRNLSTQRWVFSYLSDGYYSIRSAYPETPYYLGVENDSPNIRAKIVLRDGSLSDGMKWKIDITESGAYRLVAKSCNQNYYVLNVNATMPVNNVELLQDTYFWDDNYQDEWFIWTGINIGMSSDNYTDGCANGTVDCYHYANDFLVNLRQTRGGGLMSSVYHYNRNSNRTASKVDFSVNGAISNDIDFMVYLGHGLMANDESGNYLHYNCAVDGTSHTSDHTNSIYNVYTSEVKFGADDSKLRWVWLYTCNFLNAIENKDYDTSNVDNLYVTDSMLRNMMNGAHIVLGYASQARLGSVVSSTFADYLDCGEPIIMAFLKAGTEAESTIAKDNHIQKVLYIPQAMNETIYSPYVDYDYAPDDVQIITNQIMDMES
ncbi:MAG: RICIN domain-containing protein [Oscillospiraceae bacterium]|nr:RICIN domain-containing protein [Oscillospiraceae bacterium]